MPWTYCFRVFKLSLKITAVLLALLFCLPAAAEGLLQAYQQALTNDPLLREAVANRRAGLEAKPQARALSLPDIDANASVQRTFATSPGSSGTNASYGVNLTQPIFNQGNRVRQRQADVLVSQAETNFLIARQDTLLRVAERYFDVLSAQQQLEFARANKNAIARQREQARQRYDVGLITITDVHEAQARFDSAVTQEISALNQLANSKEALREVTGQFYEQIKKLRARIPLKAPDPANPDAWVDLALNHSPNLRGSLLAAELARKNVDLQRAGHYPTVNLTAGYQDTKRLSGGASENHGGQIGLQLNVPIFRGGAVVSQTREAAAQHEAAKERQEQLQRAVIRQVRDAYRGVQTAISEVKAFDQARVSNSSALSATEAGFDVGTRTIVDVLDAQRDLFAAERDYNLARYAYLLNHLRLKRAAGRIVEVDLEQIEGWLD